MEHRLSTFSQIRAVGAQGLNALVDNTSAEGRLIYNGKSYKVTIPNLGSADKKNPTVSVVIEKKQSFLQSLKEFFAHRLFRGTFSSQAKQLQSILNDALRQAALNQSEGGLVHLTKNAQTQRFSFFKRIAPKSVSSPLIDQRFADKLATTQHSNGSLVVGIQPQTLNILGQIACDTRVTVKSIVSFLTNDGKTCNSTNQALIDVFTSAKAIDSQLFSNQNIEFIRLRESQSPDAKADIYIRFKNTYELEIPNPLKIDMRSGTCGEFRGQRACDVITALRFTSLSELAELMSQDDNYNFKKQMATLFILRELDRYTLTSAQAAKLFEHIPQISELVRYSDRANRFFGKLRLETEI